MALVNTLKTLNIPILGKPYSYTEDEFLNSGWTMLKGGNMSSTTMNDAGSPQEIMIACKNKRRRVTGYLSEGVTLEGVSEWKEFINEGLISTFSKGLTTVDTLAQMGFAGQTTGGGNSAGTSVRQPWMNRKFWNGSKPFTLNFNFNFVAESSAKDEVFAPAEALLSFCYPREIHNVELAEQLKSTWGDFSSSGTSTSGGPTVMNGISDAVLNTFAIPGPSLRYDPKLSSDNGDAVTIVVGNMFAFGACYLKTVRLEFAPTIDYSGFPIWCKVSISAEAMDANYCDEQGNFFISQWSDSAAGLSSLMDAVTTTATQAAKDMMNIAKSTVNALKPTYLKIGGTTP